MTVEAFYDWVVSQEHKYELVNGEPMLMAGASRRHDRIAANGLRIIGNQLQNRPCQPFTGDTYIRIPSSASRRMADFGVDCGHFDDASLEASEPVLVVDILSPTTRTFDSNDKLEEYKTVPTLRYILLIDPDQPQARLYRRDGNGDWTSERIAGLEAAVALPGLGLRLLLVDLYAGLSFRPRPSLVETSG